MKKSLYILAAFAALVACNKELDIQNQVNPEEQVNNESNVHELFASFPELVDDETKAVINNGNGTFAWEENDAIAVVTDGGNVYKYETTGSGNAARFTYTGDISGTPTTIYFPWVEGYSAADYASMSVPTSINGLTGALSGDAIRLTGTITQSEGKYVSQLSYRNAFLRVTVKNVPAFAKYLGFDIGKDWGHETTIEFTLSDKQDIVAYFPVVTNEDIQFAVSLLDDSGNYIYRKETSSAKSFTDGSLLTMKPMEVGPILTFDNQSGWTPGTLYVGGQNWDVNITSFNTSYDYPYKMLSRSDGVLYVVLPADIRKDIALSFTGTGQNQSTGTQCVYLYRDIDFEIPDGGGLKTDYMVYPFKQNSSEKVNIKTVPAIFTVTYGWDPVKIYIWGDGSHNSSSWADAEYMTWYLDANNNKYWYYPMESNTPTTNFNFIIYNSGGSEQTGNLIAEFSKYKTISYEWGHIVKEHDYSEEKEINISSEINSASYFTLPKRIYGSNVLLKVGNTYWPITADRDYSYGY